jgi:hypothetical protein
MQIESCPVPRDTGDELILDADTIEQWVCVTTYVSEELKKVITRTENGNRHEATRIRGLLKNQIKIAEETDNLEGELEAFSWVKICASLIDQARDIPGMDEICEQALYFGSVREYSRSVLSSEGEVVF